MKLQKNILEFQGIQQRKIQKPINFFRPNEKNNLGFQKKQIKSRRTGKLEHSEKIALVFLKRRSYEFTVWQPLEIRMVALRKKESAGDIDLAISSRGALKTLKAHYLGVFKKPPPPKKGDGKNTTSKKGDNR